VDITYKPSDDILEDFHTLMRELERYNPSLAQKDQFVLINKTDLYSPVHRNMEALKNALNDMGLESLPISALTGQGLDELKTRLAKRLLV
jgi:GTP-binding protein